MLCYVCKCDTTLVKVNNHWICEKCLTTPNVESMDAKFAAALKALEDYGQHREKCACWQYYSDFSDIEPAVDDSDCDCGLSTKWRELNK